MNRRNFLKLIAASAVAVAVPLPAVVAGAPAVTTAVMSPVVGGCIPAGTMMCFANESRTMVRPMLWGDAAKDMVGCMWRTNKIRLFTESQLKWAWGENTGKAKMADPPFFYKRVPLRRLDDNAGGKP